MSVSGRGFLELKVRGLRPDHVDINVIGLCQSRLMTGRRFETLGGVLGDAEVRIFFDFERQAQETELVLQIDVRLQRVEIRQRVGIPVIISFGEDPADRKSTRLNSSHVKISYAVFCLKKK